MSAPVMVGTLCRPNFARGRFAGGFDEMSPA